MNNLLSDPLVVMATKHDGAEALRDADVPILYTGVGKVNATHALARRLADYRHAQRPMPLVVNFGTAGAARLAIGSGVVCTRFIQTDMDVTPLGFPKGVTPYDEAPDVLEFPLPITSLPSAICGTSDAFSLDHCGTYCDVVDMEAYALAKVCFFSDAGFVSVKFVTDNADRQAPHDWCKHHIKAAPLFLSTYKELLGHRRNTVPRPPRGTT